MIARHDRLPHGFQRRLIVELKEAGLTHNAWLISELVVKFIRRERKR